MRCGVHTAHHRTLVASADQPADRIVLDEEIALVVLGQVGFAQREHCSGFCTPASVLRKLLDEQIGHSVARSLTWNVDGFA